MNKKIILILGILLLAFAPFVSAEQCYEDKEITSLGKSMLPLIPRESILEFESIENIEDLKVGDIIDFNYEGFFKYEGYTHRIIKTGYDRKGWYARTKGDNNFLKDFAKLRKKNIGCKLIKINGERINEEM